MVSERNDAWSLLTLPISEKFDIDVKESGSRDERTNAIRERIMAGIHKPPADAAGSTA